MSDLAARPSRVLVALAGALLVLAGPLLLAAAAYGAGQATDGICAGDTGVTVVVDGSALDGGTQIRCVPDAEGMSGLEALQKAGFDVTGTRRYGKAMVCRIDNRPSPQRELAITGDEDYRETCTNTVPTAALWAYWHAENGGEWAYSQRGPKSRTVQPGGFEGWSFTLNASEDGNPPGVDPVREGASARSESAASEQASGNAATDEEPDGSSVAPWVAGAVIVVAGLGSLVSVRRRRARGNGDT